MGTDDEVVTPTTSDATPLPIQVGEMVLPCALTPAVVLGWIGAYAGLPWFPSRHAAITGIDRAALDDPLALLRVAGLVRIATWVRGVGQGYVLTPEGEGAIASGTGIPTTTGKPPEPLSSGPLLTIEDDPDRSLRLPIDPRPPVVVPALLIANVLWFFVGIVVVLWLGLPLWTYLSEGNGSVSHRLGSVGGRDLLRGDWWRLLTSCFVHAGGFHLLVNLFMLAMIGPLAELLWGRRRLAVIYVLSGLSGSCLAMALHPEGSLVGASGALWGVLTSLLAWFVLFRPHLPPEVVTDATGRLTLIIVLNAGLSFIPGISWQAHLGGGIAGLVVAWLLNAATSGDRNRRRIAFGLLLAVPVVSVGGLISVMGRGEVWVDYKQRIADEQTHRATEAATAAFIKDVAPRLNQLLNQLNPKTVLPVQQAATWQLLRPGSRRNPTLVAETVSKLTALKAVSDEAIELLSSPPLGVESLDRHRSRAKEFAEARSQSFGLLLDMLANDGIPNETTLAAWGHAKRATETLWEQVPQR